MVDDRYPVRDEDVLLIVRVPPPYGGGEAVGALLERLFTGRFGILAFRRPSHQKASQGRLSAGNLLFGLRYAGRSTIRIAKDRPRVVYLDIPKDTTAFLRSSVVVLVARSLRVRVVGDLAGADFVFLRGSWLVRRYGRWVLGSIDAIRVLGESVVATLRAHGLENTVVISNGIEDPRTPEADAGGVRFDAKREFLYVGKIARAKGIATLVEFVDTFRDNGQPFCLHVVGEWENEQTRTEIEDEVRGRGLEDLVVFHGRLVGDAKWRVYARAHLLLHPTHWDGQPVTILEALAFGLPVVATRIGAIPDTISTGDEGYLMADSSPAELRAGVLEIMRDEQTYDGYRSRARASFEQRFTQAVFGQRMAGLLRSTAAERSGRPERTPQPGARAATTASDRAETRVR